MENKFYPDRVRLLHGHKANETSKDNEPLVPPSGRKRGAGGVGTLCPNRKEIDSIIKTVKERDDMPVWGAPFF